jgi:tetratricopeptide (TPR) repeat protein
MLKGERQTVEPGRRLKRAIEYHRTGDLNRAGDIYREIIGAFPGHADALHLLGVIALQSGRNNTAEDFINKAILNNPRVPAYYMNLGVALKNQGKGARAVSCYGKAIALQPDNAEAYHNMGNAYHDLGKMDEAIESYRRAVALKPVPETYLNLGNANRSRGRLKEALECYEHALAIKPDCADAHMGMGMALHGGGDLEKAVFCYLRAMEAGMKTPRVYSLVAAAHKGLGDYEKAVSFYEKALSTGGDQAETYNHLGICLQRRGDFEKAVSCYEKALSFNPEYAEAHNNMGTAYFSAGDMESAVSCYETALSLRPDYADACNNLGNALREKGEPERAIAFYERAVAADPECADVYSNMAAALQDQGRLNEAVASCRRSLEINPGCAATHNNLANILYDLDDADTVLAHYRKAIGLDSGYENAYNNLAGKLERLNRLDEARRVVDKALRLDSASFEANLNLARLEYRAGEYRTARSLLEGLLVWDPSNRLFADASSLLGLVCDKMGDHDAAFSGFSDGNARRAILTRGKGLEEQAGEQLERIDRIRRWFTPGRIEAWRGERPKDRFKAPIFLVGFPRSGTTLLNQILDSHSAVLTLEEQPTLARITADFLASGTLKALDGLSPDRIHEYRSDYWDRVRAVGGAWAEDSKVVDKLPLNIICMGLIHRFFPEAKVIVALRDPRDAVLSNFMQDFSLNPSMYHSLTLEGASGFYARVMGLYLHFRGFLPLDMREVRYEDLVENTGPETRGLFDFLGLEWEEGVLGFHERALNRKINTPSYSQVVRPIYRHAVSRWRKYSSHLEPVLSLLEPFVEAFGYGASAN